MCYLSSYYRKSFIVLVQRGLTYLHIDHQYDHEPPKKSYFDIVAVAREPHGWLGLMLEPPDLNASAREGRPKDVKRTAARGASGSKFSA